MIALISPRLLALLLFLTGISVIAAGQAPAAISGAVFDPTGAAIPGAQISLTRAGGGAPISAISDATGQFSAIVPAGTYDVAISASGFKTKDYSGVQSGSAALRAVLELDSTSETVTIEAGNSTLETATAELQGTLESRKIESVPVNGRSFTDMLALTPGVVPSSSAQPNAVVMSGCTSTPPSGDLNAGNLSVAGQRETSNGFVVNGSVVEEDFNNGTAVVPNLDSIQELKVITSAFNPEYGNYSGGQVMVETKGGGDNWHGSAFDFVRNTALDARGYFAPDRATYDRQQFGGTFGGPIRKGKAYFFADYQGTRMTQGIDTGLISVPSNAMRAGDFSSLIDAKNPSASSLNGMSVSTDYLAAMLSQKLGYSVTAGEPYFCTTNSTCVFQNAIIPQSVWSAPAKHLLQYIPAPNVGTNSFSTSAQDEKVRDDKGALRFDLPTRLGALSSYYFVDDYWLNNPYPTAQGGASVPGFNAISVGRSQLASLNLTKAFGANTVNDFHFSYMRSANVIGQPKGGVGPSLASQGFVEGEGTAGIVPLAPQIEGIENVSFSDFTIGVVTTNAAQVNNTWEWADAVSHNWGHHTLKLGGDFHLDQVNIAPNAIYNGAFMFQGSETGSDFADFLLGVPSSYSQGDSRSFYLRNHYIGVFAQDTYQLRPNLSLTYGLRWDVLPPWHEKYNQLQTLVLGEQSVVYPGAPRGLVFPGDPGIPNTLAPTKYNDFSPRIGITYSPSFSSGPLAAIFGTPSKSTIHAGFGTFYTAFEGLSAGIMSANPPYGYDYTSTSRPLFATPFISASGQNLGQPFPSPIPGYGASASNPNNSVDWSKYMPITGVPAFYYKNRPPYTERYSISLDRELARNTVLSVAYVGSQAHHLLAIISANPGNATLCLSTPGCGPFNEAGARGPFSSDFDAINYQKTMASSNYNSLEISVRRTSGPLQFTAGYTYGKSIDDSSSLAEPINPINPSLTRAISAFDLRHNFVVSYNYVLPIVRLLGADNRWTTGWTLSGVTRFSTGLPVTLFNNQDTSLLGSIPNGINNNGVDTLNYTAGKIDVNLNPRDGRNAFNTALFSLPALGQNGSARRRFFYGPGMENFDVALAKEIKLNESRQLQFRLEAFNLFNHAQFFGAASVNGNISSSNFGRIVNAMP
ncbi:MAG TPA: TonB-dependent receptor, partial [Candidatus Acidoferrales bacterium]|nr:TonB-dependent receptor [Candidatus Acidoferrales bacterium]